MSLEKEKESNNQQQETYRKACETKDNRFSSVIM